MTEAKLADLSLCDYQAKFGYDLIIKIDVQGMDMIPIIRAFSEL
ncbi:hypothetical protein [Treponema primitia]